MSPYTTRNRAFTLIELLIVITIIGILAVALIPRLTGGPARARDATAKSDLQQLATALEFYANDNSGGYPQAAAYCVGTLFVSGGTFPLTSYMTTIPAGSIATNTVVSTGCGTGYAYFPINTAAAAGGFAEGYALVAMLETTSENGAAGIYNGTGMFTPSAAMVLSTTASASAVLAGDTLCTAAAPCAAGVTRYYMIAH